jgi:two-component system, OmpR family, response regulator ResD
LKGTPRKGMGNTPNSYRILIVDDHPTILEILSEFLSMNGYQVIATQDGGKALELLATETFDLVLTDLQMPIVDGWMVAERAKMKNTSIPVLILSGSIEQYTRADLSPTMLLIDELLTKPIDLGMILRTIQRHLSSSAKTTNTPC